MSSKELTQSVALNFPFHFSSQKGSHLFFPLVFHITTNFRNFVYNVADDGKFKKTISQVLNKQNRREMKVMFSCRFEFEFDVV